MKELNFLLILLMVFFSISCEKEELTLGNKDSANDDTAVTADNTKKDTPNTDPAETDSAETLSYLALGDSYTIGQSVAEEERYPVLLAKGLTETGIEIHDPTIIATTGWTTADLKRGIENARIEGNEYDLVSLLIGVNNQYQGTSAEEYKKEFRDLLLQAIDFAKGDKDRVFVISIPDYGYTPFGASRQEEISPEINLFNLMNKEVTVSLGLKYFDITPISRKGLSDPSLVAGDGLHPSGKMYQLWVDLMLVEVLEMVKAI